MHKKVKIRVFGLLLTVIFACMMLYNFYNRPMQINVSEIENINQIPIDDVITMFKDDEEKANATFVEKVIEVEGVIKEISFLNNRHTIILNSKSFTQSFVICDISPLGNDKVHKFTIGDTVVLRGVCKGYLLDVIMLNCMPINEKTS